MFLLKKIILFFFVMRWIKPSQRKELAPYLRKVPFRQLGHITRFLKQRSREKSILIIEGNLFHGEVIPGLVQYFNEFGYYVDVLLHRQVMDEDPFVRTKLDMSIFEISLESLALISRLDVLGEYQTVLINSTQQWDGVSGDDTVSFEGYFGVWPRGKMLPILMEHDIAATEQFFHDKPQLMERVITLGRFAKGRMVNSHYFGPSIGHQKCDITTFVLVGGIDIVRRNHQLVINAMLELAKREFSFRALIVGRGTLSDLPEVLQQHVEVLGRLNFADMFATLESADFILTGLDPDNPEHNRYISTGVTGTAQLCYGFHIPPIMEQKFASFYGFDNSNSIVYEGDLFVALKQAVEMNDKDYQSMRAQLADLAKSIKEESRENLRELLFPY